MKKHTLIRLLAVLICITLLLGCAAKDRLIGKWEDANGSGFEFFKNGTVITDIAIASVTAKYSLPDDDHLTIEFEGLLNIAGPKTYTIVELKKDRLILAEPNGISTEYTRVK